MIATPSPETVGAGPPPKRTVLIVDDSPMDRLLAGGLVEKLGGWEVLTASSGAEALELMEKQRADLVLTDLLMPEMDGLQLTQSVRANYPLVPVILMTAHGSEDIAIQALQTGAASYVPKKSLARDLGETLEQVFSASRTTRDLRRLLEYQTHLESHFVLENEPALIPSLVGYLEDSLSRMGLIAPSGLVLLGVALHEALNNAMYHGNLELGSDLRERDEESYYRTAEQRRKQKPWSERRVYVTARLSKLEAVFVVRDEGPGFDPSALPNPTDPANLERVSGRGLLLIQTFMDRIEHNETGNQITMAKRRYA